MAYCEWKGDSPSHVAANSGRTCTRAIPIFGDKGEV
jgi:hypothetical protein